MKRLKTTDIKAYRENMLNDQGGKCAFCGQDCKKPCLDHAHKEPYKDKVRGVICNWCNIAIGKLENARVRTGTDWDEFRTSFPKVWTYAQGSHINVFSGYQGADWHPDKRKSEVIEFRKMKAEEQMMALIDIGYDGDADWGTPPRNATERVALFKRLNNKT